MQKKPVNQSSAEKEGGYPSARPIRVKNINDARRLLSRLIYQLQVEQIEGRQAKDLTYLLISYVSITRDSDLEQRLAAIEEKIKNET